MPGDGGPQSCGNVQARRCKQLRNCVHSESAWQAPRGGDDRVPGCPIASTRRPELKAPCPGTRKGSALQRKATGQSSIRIGRPVHAWRSAARSGSRDRARNGRSWVDHRMNVCESKRAHPGAGTGGSTNADSPEVMAQIAAIDHSKGARQTRRSRNGSPRYSAWRRLRELASRHVSGELRWPSKRLGTCAKTLILVTSMCEARQVEGRAGIRTPVRGGSDSFDRFEECDPSLHRDSFRSSERDE